MQVTTRDCVMVTKATKLSWEQFSLTLHHELLAYCNTVLVRYIASRQHTRVAVVTVKLHAYAHTCSGSE